MPGVPSILLAGLTGFISGLLLSVPVGPVNLTIMNEGARRGFKWAIVISLGAVSMELIYCFIAFTGFAAYFQKGWVKTLMEIFSFLFMVYLGLRFVIAKSGPAMEKFEHRIEERIELRLHPTSAFMTGFIRTLANPGVLLGYIILGANFIAHGWVKPTWTGKLCCLTGVGVGVGAWFFGLSWAISLAHKKITGQTLLKMERGSGILLLLLAVIHGGYLVWQVTHHKL